METTLTTVGCKNFRDLGGLPYDGGFTGFHKVYRSDSLWQLTAEDVENLRKEGINCVIDLRTGPERIEKPNPAENTEGFDYYHISLFDGVKSKDYVNLPAMTLPQMYKDMLDEAGEYIAEVFKVMIKHKDGCIVYHCVAGKDRTGIISALLLKLTGVPDEEIIANYALSSEMLKDRYVEMLKKMREAGHTPLEHLFWTEPEYMREFLDHLETKHNGVSEYLSKYLNKDEINILADLLKRSNY